MQVTQLSRYDFPDELITSWQSQGIKKLLPIQEQAIKHYGLFDGESFIVSAPTSSGKTFIGEMAAVYQGQKRRKTVYLVPLKALAEEKYEHFRKLYEPYGIRIAVSTRDRKEFDEALNNGEFEIAIVVYEKFFQLLNSTPKFLSYIGLVVVDELQLLADASRGSTVESILTKLKMLNGKFQLIGMTAVLGNNRKVNEWLDIDLLHYDRRPIELHMGYLWDGVFHFRTYNSQESGEELLLADSPNRASEILLAVVTKLAQQDEQSLIFVKDKDSTRSLAIRLAEQIDLPPAETALEELSDLESTISNDKLGQALEKGVAFHNADLTPDERSLVERHFRQENIKVLVSTTTLAMGVNLPTRNVFIQLEKWHSIPGERRPYSISLPKSDFENMGGRAGRFQLEDDFGRAIAVLTRQIECDQFRNIYLDGKLEDIEPNLWRDSMATTVLGIVALGGCKTLAEVREFLQNTLTWHLYRKDDAEQTKLNEQLEQGITNCFHVGVLKETKGKKLVLTKLGKSVAANGVRVETGGILKDWLEGRGDSVITATEAIIAAVITPDGQEAYLNMSTAEYRQIGHHYRNTIHEFLGQNLYQLFREQAEYRLDDYQIVKTFKIALLLTDYIGTMTAREIEEHYHTYFGAVKRVAEHISWVLSSAVDIAKVLEFPESWMATLSSLAAQVQYGLPAEGIRLAQLRVPRLGRERIRSLLREGAVSYDDILEAGEEFIASLTTKPVARQLIKRISNLKQNKGQGDTSSDIGVTQRDNRGSVVVGVNTGTIIVGKEDKDRTKPKANNGIDDITGLKSTEWRKEIDRRIDELNQDEIKELYENARELHHNRLRPSFRDAARCSTKADLKRILENIKIDYHELTNLFKTKLSLLALPDYTDDLESVKRAKTLEKAQAQLKSLGNSLLRRVARLVNLLEDYRVTPEAILLEALESFEDQTNSIVINHT
ncbi:MAG: DEAD/DEAH box helicase, partial [Candidatus Hatepunaea meridiana]|nr:DEAD/DEAH box helicase [Candidatus Hatepunaea meridiana]